MWINYRGEIYYCPNNSDAKWVDRSIVSARSRYIAFTSTADQRMLENQIIRGTKIDIRYKERLAGTNANLVLKGKTLRVLEGFRLLQSFENGDGLIQTLTDDPESCYVFALGRAPDGKNYKNTLTLIYKDLKTYDTVRGGTKTVKAYDRGDLDKEDRDALLMVRDAFRDAASRAEQEIGAYKKQGSR